MKTHAWLVFAWVLLSGPAAAEDAANLGPAVDRIFSAFASSGTPGCAVGLTRDGRTILERSYGMADLEHDVPNATGTIFEAGSIAKQFTAAAVVVLAQQGRLSLDDPVRRYLPELPAYADAISLRQMLNHTSGLRDWGGVVEAAGWPRGTRVHTHDHVLDVLSRQKALNYEPGTEYLYVNSGYNLAAMVVARVSGKSFAEFTRERLFTPLGLKHTQWRDDFTRVVKGRAVAYSRGEDGWFQSMPFENVHGNGGLLTTVGDLLTWTEKLGAGQVGAAGLLESMQQRGRLTDGRETGYGLGLELTELRGVREISHSGSTSGYRAFLARYPDQRVAVAVLCNAAQALAVPLGKQVVSLVLGQALQPPAATTTLPADSLAAGAGLYRSRRTGVPLRLVFKDGKLLARGWQQMVPLAAGGFRLGNSSTRIELEAPRQGRIPGLRYILGDGDVEPFDSLAEFKPDPSELPEYSGEYVSDEAEATLRFSVEEGQLVFRQRPSTRVTLSPAYRDAFTAPAGGFLVLLFRRDGQGRVDSVSLVSDRVRDLRFRRALGASSAQGR